MAANRDDLIERLRQRLLASANRAGWSYHAGKSSRIEPTCWALLALAHAGAMPAPTPASVQPHIEFLAGLQAPDGLLVETEPALANLSANGLAAITLAHVTTPAASARLEHLVAGLVSLKGVRLEPVDPRQDSTLQGWPWVRDTFSWVEPTSWCLLALKRSQALGGSASGARRAEAERLLANRMCTGGGWNFGNAIALGQDLRPYVPTTAVALLALQDKKEEGFVRQSIEMLRAQRLAEPGAMTLALASLCLRLYGVAVDDVDNRLSEAVVQSEESGNVLAIAMALVALTADRHHGDAFRVA